MITALNTFQMNGHLRKATRTITRDVGHIS